MGFAELKSQIAQLPPREMLKVMAFLKHLRRADTTEHQWDLARRHAEMDAGRKVILTRARR